MKTICTNPECQKVYNVKPEALGKLVRCLRCSEIFKIAPYEELVSSSELLANGEDDSEDSEPQDSTNSQDETSGQKKTTKEVIAKKKQDIRREIKKVIPMLLSSYEKKENESDTRLLIDVILKDVLGYQIDDIKTEQKINGKKADYVLSIKGEDVLIIEAKAIKITLHDKHIYQATTYGAYSGIKWVVLTNGLVWQLYRISTGERVSHDLIFTVDLLDGLDEEEAAFLHMISKDGISRKNLLESHWEKIRALSPEILLVALLSEDVISKVRTTLAKQTGYNKLNNEELRQVIEENLLSLT